MYLGEFPGESIPAIIDGKLMENSIWLPRALYYGGVSLMGGFSVFFSYGNHRNHRNFSYGFPEFLRGKFFSYGFSFLWFFKISGISGKFSRIFWKNSYGFSRRRRKFWAFHTLFPLFLKVKSSILKHNIYKKSPPAEIFRLQGIFIF